jgi:hypothetical protein
LGWSIFWLEHPALQWRELWRRRCTGEIADMESIDLFWEVLRAKVESGEIEIVEESDNWATGQVLVTEREAIAYCK